MARCSARTISRSGAQDKAGRQRLARELRLTPDSLGQRATIKNRLSSHNALIDLAAIDMRELRPEPRRGPKVANRPPGFAPPMVPETASRKDNAGDWWLLDSKGPKREQINPQDYLERMRKAGNDTVGIVFQKQAG